MVCDDTYSRDHVEFERDDSCPSVKPEPSEDNHDLELTLHALLTQANDPSDASDPLHCAIEKAISEMELPEMMGDTPGDWDSLGDGVGNFQHIDEPTSGQISSTAQLTVDRILAEHTLHSMESKDGNKRKSEEELEIHEDSDVKLKKPTIDVAHDQLQHDKIDRNTPEARIVKASAAYETLSPASLSPTSDSESQYKHKKHQPFALKVPTSMAAPKPTLTQKVHKPVDAPSKFTEEYTMAQVAEVKKRIINTHKLLLNFNFLKDGYARTSVELKRTLLRLKQSEIHRAHLLQENEQLKRLVIEQSDKLDIQDVTG
ncbi:LAME_0E03884g1_1 [Lachancea meyersii CBS 8951]|uniref:LAME_0E03884g1_1 n=1 Tax=Lachancea meyersii CBS 8951 TaxID=1266667 RepID=A0A1G4JGL6_9SACH|nr:LAME_0E03884g1_1 [Lachancea meyersii CBS 8951]